MVRGFWGGTGRRYLQGGVAGGPGGTGLGERAPADAEYVLGAAHAELPNGRIFEDTATVTWDLSTDGIVRATAAGGGGGGGSGDVVGPASAVDDRIATFNGTTGKLIQDSGSLVSDFEVAGAAAAAVAAHEAAGNPHAQYLTQAEADALYAAISHTHAFTEIASVPTSRFLGRATAGTGAAEALTTAQAKTLLDLTGTNSGDQTITLTGEVTGTGTGSFAATIANDAVTNAKLANMAAWSVKLRNAGTSGDPSDAASGDMTEELTPASGDYLLGWDATGNLRKFDVGNLPTGGGGEANTASNVGVSGVGVFARKTGIDLEFKNLIAGSARLTVVDDTGDDEITLDVPAGAFEVAGAVAAHEAAANPHPTYLTQAEADALYEALGHTHPYTEVDSVPTARILGRTTAGTGAAEALSAATVKTFLDLTGTNSGDQTITLTGDVTGSGTGSFAATIANDAVTYAKMQNVSATDRLLGRSTAGAGDVEEITCTAFARSILDDADAATVRATIGAGTGSGDALTSGTLAQFAATTSAQLRGVLSDETGTGAAVFADSPLFAGTPTFPNTGLHLLDTDASHDLILAPGSNLSADRTLTITTGDADRTLTISASTTLGGGTHSGTNTGDQTITLTGDVTGSGTGSFAATIAAEAVTVAKMHASATDVFFGRDTAGAGAGEEITVTAAKALLSLSGANTGDQTILLTGDVTGTGTGTFATTIANNAVTFAKMQDLTIAQVIGRASSGTGDPEAITIGTNQVLGYNGVTFGGKTLSGSYFSDASITLAKLSNINSQTILGRGDASTGVISELTLETGITITTGEVFKAAGRYLRRTIYTSGSGTHTPGTDCNLMRVYGYGSGGGGGGADQVGAGQTGVGAGGAAGAYCEKIAANSGTYSYAIGAAGTGGTAGDNDGNAGTDCTFSGTNFSLNFESGPGGQGGASTATANANQGGTGGLSTGGDINGSGQCGFPAGVINGAGGVGFSGQGGSSPWGRGGGGRVGHGVGSAGTGYGAGGGGGFAVTASTPRAGGDGTTGIIIVEEMS